VARALCDLAPRVGLAVYWVAQGALATDAPAARRVLDDDAAEAVAAAVPPASWVVVATQGRRDMPALQAALQLGARRLWFVASERKAGVLKQSLVAAGADPTRVAAMVAPAGLPIGAHTPEEIALSVLAAVVAARRQQVNDAIPPKACCAGRQTAMALPDPTPAIAEPSSPAPALPVQSACCGG
jgi:xanthine dehydrogenase accessory factor